ncbi:MAG TPA: zinc ribbon domain-containing protein, partial [Acidiferrobacterales bacterium]|nr:zinc ribbon domain-containing protein [Acidiferrobacterales bacterium]
MVSTPCPFCDGINPSDARFCNACGSPMHLKPCKQCGAVSELAELRCGVCGREFALPTEIVDEVHPVASAVPDRGHHSLKDIHFEAEPAPALESETEGLSALLQAFEDDAAGAPKWNTGAPARNLSTIRTEVTSLPALARPVREVIAAPAAAPPASRRRNFYIVAGALSLAALAIPGYYALRPSVTSDSAPLPENTPGPRATGALGSTVDQVQAKSTGVPPPAQAPAAAAGAGAGIVVPAADASDDSAQ